MNVGAQNIYRLKKHDWTPLLSFGGSRTRTSSDGWHSYPYGSPYLRTLGVRWRDASGNVAKSSVAFRKDNVYETYDTHAGFTCDIKFPHQEITAIWYRYANVNAIIPPLTEMKKLTILSFREHMINFGDCDLSQCPNFSHFEISKGGSIKTVTFHPDAPLKFAYLDSHYPVQVKDACLSQAYKHRSVPNVYNYGERLIGVSGYSSSLQYMADELINNYGWSIS